MKKTATSSPISRRTMLRSSGALAATTAVLAACSSTKPAVARIGASPTTVKLEDLAATDVILLRTAMSMETMAAAMLSDSAVTSLATKDSASVIAAFATDHTSHLEDLRVLISARNGEAYSETNTKLMQAYGQTALDLVASGKLPADTLALTLAVETLIAATYQYFVSLTAEPALRADMVRLGGRSSRRAAVAAQLINGGTAGFAPATDAAGAPLVATLPGAFGSLSAVQVQLGPVNDTGTRATVLMDTPSLNSLIY
ncbi:MAG: ferritin-like domain-containing protein [Ilumatobacteraceae bacterium]